MTDSWLEVGRVRSASAHAREVRVTAKAGYEYVFADMAWIRFRRPAEDLLRCKVIRTRPDGDVTIVALSPGISREVVGQLRGATIVVTPEELPPKPDSAFRTRDLLGFRVVLPTGSVLGTIGEVYEGPANDAFAVDRPDGGRSILPAIDAVFESIDVEKNELRVGDITPYVVEED
ncbi:MAG: hypothetical protein L3K26_11360 [Candidatus Hydrogenedentes bacterium]|nr:hypothetical protein [Candidatus Hydrogenedentota bacterium]